MKLEPTIEVLIVDDDTIFVENLISGLKENFGGKVQVIGATKYEYAKKLLQSKHFDVILLDYFLDGVTAEEIIREFLETGSYIIAISGAAKSQEAAGIVMKGSNDFWSKNESFEKLFLKIRHYIDRKEQEIALPEVREEYPIFNLFLTENKNLIASIISFINRLESKRFFSTLIVGETGTGKSHFVSSVYNYFKLNKNVDFRKVTKLPHGATEEEIRQIFADIQNRFRQGEDIIFLVDGLLDIPPKGMKKLLDILEFPDNLSYNEMVKHKNRLYIFAESNKPLEEVKNKLPESVYHRFKHTLWLPPLRKRWEDILLLAEHFIKKKTEEKADGVNYRLTHKAKFFLLNFKWEANVLQLQNVIENLIDNMSFNREDSKLTDISEKDLQETILTMYPTEIIDLNGAEKERIEKALMVTDCNKTRAARLLGISRPTLNHRMAEYGIEC